MAYRWLPPRSLRLFTRYNYGIVGCCSPLITNRMVKTRNRPTGNGLQPIAADVSSRKRNRRRLPHGGGVIRVSPARRPMRGKFNPETRSSDVGGVLHAAGTCKVRPFRLRYLHV